ncbi:MAG: hypothetical protein WC346_20020 [Methanogenium sp.]|jgi:hypothetical protein
MKHEAKRFAIDFISPYILRGDSVESIISGQGGQSCSDFRIQIGGYIWDSTIQKLLYHAKRDEIVVDRIGNKNCLFIFKVSKLADEIMSGQLVLV